MRQQHGVIVGLILVLAVSSVLLLPGGALAQGGPLGAIQSQLNAISAQLEALGAPLANRYEPFKVEIPAGMCDSAASPSSNPEIVINSDGSDTFVVSSILIKRAFQNPVDFVFLTINGVVIDGTQFDTRTGNLFDPIGLEAGVKQSADIMGMPVRRGGTPISSDQPGGNVPHQIVAQGGGIEDVKVMMFCRSDIQDLQIETVLVAGWKKAGDTITVSYIPGN
jgi:hypothetical protein